MLTKTLFISFLAILPLSTALPSTTQPTTTLDFRNRTSDTSSNVTRRSNLKDETVLTAWYPGWLGKTFPPDKISWSKYNVMTFAFAMTTPDAKLISLDSDSAELLPTFVAQAKENNVSPLLSIGGWTGSQYFSSAVASAANRTTLVNALVDLVEQYKLAGIDFDWEYPNKQGVGCNIISPNDSANFLSFLKELRKNSIGSGLILSAAVGMTPFAGTDGKPMSDVSGFADVLDFIAIMAYDVWGSFSASVGPNAPLKDSCAPSPAGSGQSAVDAWTAAKFPANQITLGVASYGRSYSVKSSAASKIGDYPVFDATAQPLGEEDTGVAGVDQCGVATGNSGLFNFEGMIKAGFLTKSGKPASGVAYKYDDCSETPFVYNKTSEVMISYDDATSFAAKGDFINQKGLMGFAMWHVVGDSNDILVDSIRESMGMKSGDH
ncbi:glycoside hydrolase family 18 protein [Crassisporium funariophilum]|nr:glycoside hydrolase family 18 protein [Crassisporium funariophilum]